MKYLSVFKTAERSTPPTQQEMDKMGALIEEGFKAGWLLSTEGCLHSKFGFRVRGAGGKFTVTDGPFTESKELVGGLAILKVASKAEAVALTKKFMTVSGEDGECELRQLYEMPGA